MARGINNKTQLVVRTAVNLKISLAAPRLFPHLKSHEIHTLFVSRFPLGVRNFLLFRDQPMLIQRKREKETWMCTRDTDIDVIGYTW